MILPVNLSGFLLPSNKILLVLSTNGLCDIWSQRASRFAILVLVEDDTALVLDETALGEGSVERADGILGRFVSTRAHRGK